MRKRYLILTFQHEKKNFKPIVRIFCDNFKLDYTFVQLKVKIDDVKTDNVAKKCFLGNINSYFKKLCGSRTYFFDRNCLFSQLNFEIRYCDGNKWC